MLSLPMGRENLYLVVQSHTAALHEIRHSLHFVMRRDVRLPMNGTGSWYVPR